MKEIKTSRGTVIQVDDEDYERLKKHAWHDLRTKNSNRVYAIRFDCADWSNPKTIYMHREILGLKRGDKKIVDHKDLNTTNNQKNNLRLASQSLNAAHRGKQKSNKTGYIGISWHKKAKKWIARIEINGKGHHLGCFDDPIEAAKAYDLAAYRARGEFAVLNFPA